MTPSIQTYDQKEAMTPPAQTQEERDKLHAEWLLSGRQLTIECKPIGDREPVWKTIHEPQWSDGFIYRRALVKKLVPLGPEDLPPGSAIKSHDNEWMSILRVTKTGVLVAVFPKVGVDMLSYQTLEKMGWLYSVNWGLSWSPCSKEVES